MKYLKIYRRAVSRENSLHLSRQTGTSEFDDVLEVDDDFHLDIDDFFGLERVLELILYSKKVS